MYTGRYELAEIPAAVMGQLKRVVWTMPSYDAAQKYYKAKSVLKNGREQYPLWETFTGRFCFTSGFCRMGGACDPLLEGTRSEVSAVLL